MTVSTILSILGPGFRRKGTELCLSISRDAMTPLAAVTSIEVREEHIARIKKRMLSCGDVPGNEDIVIWDIRLQYLGMS